MIFVRQQAPSTVYFSDFGGEQDIIQVSLVFEKAQHHEAEHGFILEKTGKTVYCRRMNPNAPEVGFHTDSTPPMLSFLLDF